jgi:hypothetical protein
VKVVSDCERVLRIGATALICKKSATGELIAVCVVAEKEVQLVTQPVLVDHSGFLFSFSFVSTRYSSKMNVCHLQRCRPIAL